MDRLLLHRILDVQEKALDDEEYMALSKEFHILNEQLLSLIGQLPEEKKDIIFEYIYVGAEMHYRLMEIACIMYSKSSTD